MKQKEEKLVCERFLWLVRSNFTLYLIKDKNIKSVLQQKNHQLLNPVVKLIIGPATHLIHHLVFLFPCVSLLSFAMLLRNFPDVVFLQLPALCLQRDLKCASLQSISASPSWEKREDGW